jgi:NADH:ubiquinone oxidoreductase subunit E
MSTQLCSHGYDEQDIGKAVSVIEGYGCNRRKLISILQDIQAEYGYLPRNALKQVAARLEIEEIEVFSVATFYRSFSLEPKGEHLISLCLGTACHVRGAPSILEDVERLLGIGPGRTTEDGKFSLETVNCLGACAIGPVVVIDGEYHGQMNIMKTRDLLSGYGVSTDKKVPETVN